MLLWKWKQDDTTCLLGQTKSKTLATPNDGTVTPKERPKISHMGESLKIIQRKKKKTQKLEKEKNNKIVDISSGVLINN